MKSSERCKDTFQGDRCKRERGHETSNPDNPTVHFGQFTMWNEHGALLKVQGAQPRKRSRIHNRAIRNLRNLPLTTLHPAIRADIKRHLDPLVAHFGGLPLSHQLPLQPNKENS